MDINKIKKHKLNINANPSGILETMEYFNKAGKRYNGYKNRIVTKGKMHGK